MLFKKKNIASFPAPKFKINRHFIFMEIPFDFAAPYAIRWGEGEWWPAQSEVRFVKETPGLTKIGTQFRMRFAKAPLGSLLEVTNYQPNRLIELTYKSGIITGHETISIGERANGTRIDYEMHYAIPNLRDRLLWNFIYMKKHDKNIEFILKTLKEYVTEKYVKREA